MTSSAPSSTPWLDRDFIFVAGMHRSGTTLLAKVIGSSPRSTGLEGSGAKMGEGQFLQDVYPVGRAYGGVTGWALDDASHLTEDDARATPDAAPRLWAAWSPWWDLDKEFLVEKTPINLNKLRYLQELFPNSTCVVITRHPITQSLATMKWHRRRLGRMGFWFSSLVENWVRAHEKFYEDVSHLKKVRVLRYEDLVRDPHGAVEELERFLGIDLPGAAEQFDTRRASTYGEYWSYVTGTGPHAYLQKPRNVRERIRAQFERIVLRNESKRIRRRFERRIEELGYDVDQLER